ncbi:MAG TPA: type II secretion system protein GspM [Woeseiaceae bacterium]|jgi:general secretion pathway protein M|nr:type II secretion system protein GspM [Woeseiaceae bacterium]
MKDWFESLEPREKISVACGAVVVVIAVIYGLLWAPLERSHAQLETSVGNWERSLTELGTLRALATSSMQRGSQGGNAAALQQAPIIIVDQTLRSRGLEQYRRRSQPTTSNGVRVEFEGVAFDELVLWLGDLSAQYEMHVQAGSVSAIAQAGPGRVNASLTLERAL